MSLAITRPGTGAHRVDDAIAERDSRIDRLETDNAGLNELADTLTCELVTATISACRDRAHNLQLEADLAAAVAEVKRLQAKVIRSAAEQERLRQAVINARPRITQVDTQLVRPFAPEVVLPYVSPVPYRDTSGETTQELPLIDLPGQKSPAA